MKSTPLWFLVVLPLVIVGMIAPATTQAQDLDYPPSGEYILF